MASSDSDSEASTSSDSFLNRFYEEYPRLSRVLMAFRNNPLSGNTLRMIVKGEQEIRRDEQQIPSLPTPVLWEDTAPIVISQYANYASEQLPHFWNATFPDIQDQYSDIARYEHHDIPRFSAGGTEYKLATLGRAIQYNAGNQAFWTWFDRLMIEGVKNVSEGYELVDHLGIDVQQQTLEEAVKYDQFNGVMRNDINSFLQRQTELSDSPIHDQYEDQEPIFALFVNGVHVQPSYDSIVGTIENIRSEHQSLDT